jgi:hypothetical protein
VESIPDKHNGLNAKRPPHYQMAYYGAGCYTLQAVTEDGNSTVLGMGAPSPWCVPTIGEAHAYVRDGGFTRQRETNIDGIRVIEYYRPADVSQADAAGV